MNIYGRPMFQGGSIRMAPSIKPLPRYQNGGIVKHHALQLEKYQGVNDRGVLDIYLETGEFVNPKAAYALLQKMAASGMDIRDFLPQDSSSQYRSRRDEQFKEVSPVKEHYKELGFPTKGASAMLSDALRPVGEKISQEWHSRLGKTPTYEFSEETIVEPAPDYSPNISADIYEDQTPPRDTRGFPVPREKPMPPDIRDFIDKSEAVSAARGGPIRRQAGGGIEAVMPADLGALVEPPPMPMPAPPPPGIDEALPQVEQAAQNVGEQEGAQYAMEVMSGLNAAEESGDPEQAINALRGNEMPISGRYEELATYVGDDDAERTPESVLLMVQPTIMLTEQGAMDSGIGSLMENVVGDIDMETAQGAPTAMGEGVGSLMMAQGPTDMEVGQEPPVNFNYGGPVQRFSNGREVRSLKSIYEEKLPLYTSILGTPPETTLSDAEQASIYFNLARAGLNLAAGDPSKSFAENVAIAADPFTKDLSLKAAKLDKRKEDYKKQQQTYELAALGAAEKEKAAIYQQESKKKLAAIKNAYELANRSIDHKLDLELQILKNRGLIALQIEKAKHGRISDDRKAKQAITLQNMKTKARTALEVLRNDNSVKGQEATAALKRELAELNNRERLNRLNLQHDFNLDKLDKQQLHATTLQEHRIANQNALHKIDTQLRENQNQIKNANEEEKLVLDQQKFELQKDKFALEANNKKLNAFGNSLEGKILTLVSDDKKMQAYIDNTLPESEVRILEEALVHRMKDQVVWNNETKQHEKVAAAPPTELIKQVLRSARWKEGGGTPYIESSPTNIEVSSSFTDFEPGVEEQTKGTGALGAMVDAKKVIKDTDIAERLKKLIADKTGYLSGRMSVFKRMMDFPAKVAAGEAIFQESQQVSDAVNSLNKSFTGEMQAILPDKQSEQFRKEIIGILPQPGRFFNDPYQFAGQAQNIVGWLNIRINSLETELVSGGKYSPTQEASLRSALGILNKFKDSYSVLARDPNKPKVNLDKYWKGNK